MKKIIFAILFMLLSLGLCIDANAAGPMYPGWLTVMLPGIGRFDVPPILEVQTKAYRDIVRKRIPNYPDPAAGCVTLQKKGLMEKAQGGVLEPITTMVSFVSRDLGQDSGLKRNKLVLSKADLEDFRYGIMQDTMSDKNNRYFDWSAATIEKLSCGESIKLSYKRQYKNGPITYTNINYVFDGSRLYTITVAYRDEDMDTMCANFMDIRDIPKTLKIEKK